MLIKTSLTYRICFCCALFLCSLSCKSMPVDADCNIKSKADLAPAKTVDVFLSTSDYPDALPDGVTAIEGGLLVESRQGFEDVFNSVPTEIDWSKERLVMVLDRNESFHFSGAYQGKSGSIEVLFASGPSCGGNPPQGRWLAVKLPTGAQPVAIKTCHYGRCEGPPRP